MELTYFLLEFTFVLLPLTAAQVALPVIDVRPLQFPNQEVKEVSLYSESSPVKTLNSKNFVNSIFEDRPGKTAFLINFYADWCAHCRSIVGTWENLATTAKPWSQIVTIGAVNCAQKENDLLCLANKVDRYPLMKYFPRNARLVLDAIPFETNFQPDQMEQKLIDSILDDYARNNYGQWPNFQPLPTTYEIGQLWSYTSRGEQYTHLALIFENYYDKYLGAKILLDLSKNKALKVRRVRYGNPLAFALNIRALPAFVLIKRGENSVLHKTEYRQSLLEEIDKISNHNDVSLQQSTIPLSTIPVTQRTTPSPTELKLKYVVSETDLLLTSRFALLDAVSSSTWEINGTKLTSLKNFVGLLAQFFPPLSRQVQNTLSRFGVTFQQRLQRSERAKLLFKDLHNFLVNARNKTIKREEWIKEFERLERVHDRPFPTNEDYVHCRGSEAKYRGYTCGLWTTFHALTVNAFYERGFLPNFDPMWILKSIKGYVENFFGCAECVTHFVEMTTHSFRMEDFVKNAADVILYLWNAHNIVNHRLAGDMTEDPSMPKTQFPPEFLCPACRVASTGKWNETAVLQFLSTYYGSGIRAHVEKRSLNTFIFKR